MSTVPSRVLDVSGPLGAAPGYFVLRTYDDPDFRRYTWSAGGPETEIRVPWKFVPMFEAFTGARAQLFASAQVDLTQTRSGVPLVPAFPGYFFMPVDDGALGLFSVSGAGTLTRPPTIRIGNNANHDNLGTGSLKNEAFAGAANFVTRPALAAGVMTTGVVDMGTSPIVLDVLTPALGTNGFAWTAQFVLSGTWMVADAGSFVPAT